MIPGDRRSPAGPSGVPLTDVQYRNVGAVGYAVVALGVSLLLGVIFGPTEPDSGSVERPRDFRCRGRRTGSRDRSPKSVPNAEQHECEQGDERRDHAESGTIGRRRRPTIGVGR